MVDAYVPDKGDFITLSFDPQVGHEIFARTGSKLRGSQKGK
jgi:hypothetical protein